MQTSRGPSIALIGYRGTGKTTVGRLLAARLGWDFADADAELERRIGRSIAELFAASGEPAFRDEEQRTLGELTRRQRLVLATGGGAVLRVENRLALSEFGTVVWLRAEPDILAARLRQDEAARRPALTPRGTLDEIAEVLKVREPLYRGAADLIVETGGASPEQVVERILEARSGAVSR
jgi:shikimate kinase